MEETGAGTQVHQREQAECQAEQVQGGGPHQEQEEHHGCVPRRQQERVPAAGACGEEAEDDDDRALQDHQHQAEGGGVQLQQLEQDQGLCTKLTVISTI